MLLSVSQCQEKKTILAASHCEAEEIERVAMFWQSKSILNRKKMFWRSKPIPRQKNASWFYPKSWPVWSTVWQCGSVAVWSTHTMKSWPHNIDTTDLFLSKLGMIWNIWSFIHHGVTSFNQGKLCICVFVFVYVYVYVYVYSYLPSLPCFNARKKV